jgi:hypothetical protein
MPTDNAATPEHTEASECADYKIGSFSNTQPWVVDPNRLEWLSATTQLRTRTRAQVPVLLRRRGISPGPRVRAAGV